jgi:hypothetical protein
MRSSTMAIVLWRDVIPWASACSPPTATTGLTAFPRDGGGKNLKERSCLIDGEVVCCNERGVAIFQTLWQRRNEASAFLFAFDLLELDGVDMRVEATESARRPWPASFARAGTGCV